MLVRPSSYIVFVDTILEDKVFLFHGYTNAIDMVPRRIAILLHNDRQKIDSGDFGESFETLYSRGYLTKASWEYERNGLERLISKVHSQAMLRSLPGFLIMPTYSCNLSCPYCYEAKAIELHGSTGAITDELVDKAFDSYLNYISQLGFIISDLRELGKLSLTLYGGEPLLRANKSVVSKIVLRARDYRMNIFAVTNGTQLDSFEDLLGPDLISGMQITLDGEKDFHDKRRITKSGAGTFDTIVANIDLAIGKGVKVGVRCNTDHQNKETLNNLEALFVNRGWTDKPNFSFHASPVTCTEAKKSPLEPQLFRNSREMLIHLQDSSLGELESGLVTNVHNAVVQQFSNSADSFRIKASFCGANYGMFIFDPRGDIYPCWEVVGVTEPIGHYSSGNIEFNEMARSYWHRPQVLRREKCVDCAFATICGGGCSAFANSKGENYFEEYCEDFKSFFESTVRESYLAIKKAAEADDLTTLDNGSVSIEPRVWTKYISQVRQEVLAFSQDGLNSECHKGDI